MPSVKVCCGPRCGAEPGHRAIYDAAEAGAADAGADVLPTLCRGLCRGGVTLVRPDGEKLKARTPGEARDIAAAGESAAATDTETDTRG